jgi:hypothetical protein
MIQSRTHNEKQLPIARAVAADRHQLRCHRGRDRTRRRWPAAPPPWGEHLIYAPHACCGPARRRTLMLTSDYWPRLRVQYVQKNDQRTTPARMCGRCDPALSPSVLGQLRVLAQTASLVSSDSVSSLSPDRALDVLWGPGVLRTTALPASLTAGGGRLRLECSLHGRLAACSRPTTGPCALNSIGVLPSPSSVPALFLRSVPRDPRVDSFRGLAGAPHLAVLRDFGPGHRRLHRLRADRCILIPGVLMSAWGCAALRGRRQASITVWGPGLIIRDRVARDAIDVHVCLWQSV